MMTQQGWLCPKCNTVNAPHVPTCQGIGCTPIPRLTSETSSEDKPSLITEPYFLGDVEVDHSKTP